MTLQELKNKIKTENPKPPHFVVIKSDTPDYKIKKYGTHDTLAISIGQDLFDELYESLPKDRKYCDFYLSEEKIENLLITLK